MQLQMQQQLPKKIRKEIAKNKEKESLERAEKGYDELTGFMEPIVRISFLPMFVTTIIISSPEDSTEGYNVLNGIAAGIVTLLLGLLWYKFTKDIKKERKEIIDSENRLFELNNPTTLTQITRELDNILKQQRPKLLEELKNHQSYFCVSAKADRVIQEYVPYLATLACLILRSLRYEVGSVSWGAPLGAIAFSLIAGIGGGYNRDISRQIDKVISKLTNLEDRFEDLNRQLPEKARKELPGGRKTETVRKLKEEKEPKLLENLVNKKASPTDVKKGKGQTSTRESSNKQPASLTLTKDAGTGAGEVASTNPATGSISASSSTKTKEKGDDQPKESDQKAQTQTGGAGAQPNVGAKLGKPEKKNRGKDDYEEFVKRKNKEKRQKKKQADAEEAREMAEERARVERRNQKHKIKGKEENERREKKQQKALKKADNLIDSSPNLFVDSSLLSDKNPDSETATESGDSINSNPTLSVNNSLLSIEITPVQSGQDKASKDSFREDEHKIPSQQLLPMEENKRRKIPIFVPQSGKHYLRQNKTWVPRNLNDPTTSTEKSSLLSTQQQEETKTISSREKKDQNNLVSYGGFFDSFRKTIQRSLAYVWRAKLPSNFRWADIEKMLIPPTIRGLAIVCQLKIRLDKRKIRSYLTGSLLAELGLRFSDKPLTTHNFAAKDIDIVIELPPDKDLEWFLTEIPLEDPTVFNFKRTSRTPSFCNFIRLDKETTRIEIVVRYFNYVENYNPFLLTAGKMQMLMVQNSLVFQFDDASLKILNDGISNSEFPIELPTLDSQKNISNFFPRFAKYLINFTGILNITYFFESKGSKNKLPPKGLGAYLEEYFLGLLDISSAYDKADFYRSMGKMVAEGTFIHPLTRKIIVPLCKALLRLQPGNISINQADLDRAAVGMTDILQSYFELFPTNGNNFYNIINLLSYQPIVVLAQSDSQQVAEWIDEVMNRPMTLSPFWSSSGRSYSTETDTPTLETPSSQTRRKHPFYYDG